MSKLTTLSIFKPKKYNYSLVEYLNRELKKNNIKCKKKISYIDIDIDVDSIVDNVYNKLIVDCFNGNIYLRGNNVNDKRILKIRRFGGFRDSDALYCAKGACRQIIRILNKINSQKSMNKTASIDLRGKRVSLKKITKSNANNNILDLRKKSFTKKSNIIDLRGKKVIIKKTAKSNNTIDNKCIDMRNNILDLRKKSIANNKTKEVNKVIDLRKKVNNKNERFIVDMRKTASRDFAIAIINGNIYEGDTHGECVTKFLKELGIEDIEFFDRIDLRENLGYNFYTQFAAAHVSNDEILLDNYSLENISSEQAIQILKNNYPNHSILDYDTLEKLAKIK